VQVVAESYAELLKAAAGGGGSGASASASAAAAAAAPALDSMTANAKRHGIDTYIYAPPSGRKQELRVRWKDEKGFEKMRSWGIRKYGLTEASRLADEVVEGILAQLTHEDSAKRQIAAKSKAKRTKPTTKGKATNQQGVSCGVDDDGEDVDVESLMHTTGTTTDSATTSTAAAQDENNKGKDKDDRAAHGQAPALRPRGRPKKAASPAAATGKTNSKAKAKRAGGKRPPLLPVGVSAAGRGCYTYTRVASADISYPGVYTDKAKAEKRLYKTPDEAAVAYDLSLMAATCADLTQCPTPAPLTLNHPAHYPLYASYLTAHPPTNTLKKQDDAERLMAQLSHSHGRAGDVDMMEASAAAALLMLSRSAVKAEPRKAELVLLAEV